MENQANNRTETDANAVPYEKSQLTVAPVEKATNEQPAPRKKGAYMWRAILVPTLGLHWVVSVVFFLVFGLFVFLDKQFGENTLEEFFEIIIWLLCSALVIWLSIRLGRNLALKTKVPVDWARRWLPLLVYPLFTLIVVSVSMVLSEGLGFWHSDCWDIYYWINMYAFCIVMITVFDGTPFLLFLSNLCCFVPYILSFAVCQRRLKGLKPMPKGMCVILWMIILACAGAFGYGYYERLQILIGFVDYKEDDYYKMVEVDLEPYYPWSKTNLLAKLDEPSTLTLTNKLDWNGTEALYPLYAAFAQAVLPESMLTLTPDTDDEYGWRMMPKKSGVCTYGNVVFRQNFIQETDIVFDVALSASQKEEVRQANAELTYTPIALDAFVFFVNKDCPIDGLTSQQARDIYSGKIRNWKKLGAPAGRILAFQRPPDFGSQNTMERFMGKTPLAMPLKEVVNVDFGTYDRVAQYRDVTNAIGYSFRYYAALKGNDSVKFLKLDGVEPTPENIASGRYPATVEMLAITSQHSDPECARLIEWILGPQGQELVRKTGYIPINKAAKMPENPSE